MGGAQHRAITGQCAQPSASITEAVCNFFRCFVDPARFDSGLDFAVREWSRRDEALRARVDAADAVRLSAVTGMFARHGYGAAEADARARILYFMQLGYHALDVREPMAERMGRIGAYLKGFIGVEPDADAMRPSYATWTRWGCGDAELLRPFASAPRPDRASRLASGLGQGAAEARL
jgi:hypothetical protein